MTTPTANTNVNQITLQQQQQYAPYGPQYGSTHYTNMIIMGLVATQVSKFNAKDGFNLHNISVLLLLLTVEKIPMIAQAAGEQIVPSCKAIYANIAAWLAKPPVPDPPVPGPGYHRVYEVQTRVEFVQGLVNLLGEKVGSHQVDNKRSIAFDNMEIDTVSEMWSNLHFEHEGLIIACKNELNLKFRQTHGEKKLIDVNSMATTDAPAKDPKLIKCIWQLVDDPCVQWVMKWYENGSIGRFAANAEASHNASKIYWSLREYYPYLYDKQIYNIDQIIIAFTLMGGPPTINPDGEFSFLGKTYKVVKSWHSLKYNSFNYAATFNIELSNFLISWGDNCQHSTIISYIGGSSQNNFSVRTGVIARSIKHNSSNVWSDLSMTPPTPTSAPVQTTTLRFEVTNTGTKSIDIDETMSSFMALVKSKSFMLSAATKDVSIYKIQMTKKMTKTTEPNPAYEEYEERRKLLDPAINNKELLLMLSEKPDKQIVTETYKKEIQTDLVNTCFKEFDTLYLKEHDERRIKSVLSKFTSKKELLKSLGLPNKLCVLLEGMPGTGKSSAIQTIATYLQKDIYYLNLSHVETNKDLHDIFDHVIKNCNKGIIVSEDIDAIGVNLFHSRNTDTDTDKPTIELLEQANDRLSLSYVLNLLQGTLTPDNLVFIATTNHVHSLDAALIRDGRFDVHIKMQACDRYQMNKIYNKFIGRSIPSAIIGRIPEGQITPAKFLFSIKDYMGTTQSTMRLF